MRWGLPIWAARLLHELAVLEVRSVGSLVALSRLDPETRFWSRAGGLD